MVAINSIRNGIVIDHIKAGLGVKIFKYLGLDRVDYAVAFIMNAPSDKLGKKDIIKIENFFDIDLTVLGLMDPNITINIIEGEIIKEKIKLELPERVEDIIHCKNPRCVTSIERNAPHIFHLLDEARGEYRCHYCDEVYAVTEV